MSLTPQLPNLPMPEDGSKKQEDDPAKFNPQLMGPPPLPQSTTPRSGFESKGGKIADIASSVLHGWFAGRNYHMQQQVHKQIQEVSQARESYKFMADNYQKRLDAGEDPNSESMRNFGKLVAKQYNEYVGTLGKYTAPDPGMDGGKKKGGIKEKAKEVFGMNDPKIYQHMSIQALSQIGKEAAETGILKNLGLGGPSAEARKDLAVAKESELKTKEMEQEKQDKDTLRGLEDKSAQGKGALSVEEEKQKETLSYRVYGAGDMYSRYQLKHAEEIDGMEKERRELAAKPHRTPEEEKKLHALTDALNPVDPKVIPVEDKRGHNWIITTDRWGNKIGEYDTHHDGVPAESSYQQAMNGIEAEKTLYMQAHGVDPRKATPEQKLEASRFALQQMTMANQGKGLTKSVIDGDRESYLDMTLTMHPEFSQFVRKDDKKGTYHIDKPDTDADPETRAKWEQFKNFVNQSAGSDFSQKIFNDLQGDNIKPAPLSSPPQSSDPSVQQLEQQYRFGNSK